MNVKTQQRVDKNSPAAGGGERGVTSHDEPHKDEQLRFRPAAVRLNRALQGFNHSLLMR